ncbi:unnamed protein product [Cuscuta campestris]|uniref:Integrase catalytic domain-containing protein n=1 Tax=Cuscuta campestris TaxID=132261 RepID=A0A484MB37_9ASTE|nr:unnamed protein product [Cuscuta campestris]
MGGNVPGAGVGKAPLGHHTEHAATSQHKGKKTRRSRRRPGKGPLIEEVLVEDVLEGKDDESSECRISAFKRLGGKDTRVSAFDRLNRGPEGRLGDLRRQISEGRRRNAEESATSDARSARPERTEGRRGERTQRRQSPSRTEKTKVPERGMTELAREIAELKRRVETKSPYSQPILRTGTIDDRDTLAEKFLTHFAANRRQRLPYSHLLNICIRKGEKVRDFIVRWEKEARDVHGADDQALVAMFQAALPRGDVRKELRKNPPPTYQETLARAKFLASEEFDDALESEAAPAKRASVDSGEAAKKRKKKKDYTAGPRTPSAGVYSVGAPVGAGRELALSQLPHVEAYAKEMQRLIARGPLPRDDAATPSWGPPEGRTWRKATEPIAVVTQARNPEKRHIGRECNDLDEDEAQGYPVGFIHGGNIGGDSAAQRKRWKHMAFVAKVHQAPAPKLGRREQIQFTEKDLPNTPSPHRDALVVKIEINDAIVHRTLVDTGSLVNIMYEKTFQDLGLNRKDLRPVRTPLSGFTGDSIEAERVIVVSVIVGDGAHKAKLKMEFMVVSINCAHNMILGRPGLEDLECVISLYYLCMKFPTPSGIGVARGDQKLARSCYVRITKKLPRDETMVVHAQEGMRKLEARPSAEPAKEVEEVLLDPQVPERKVKVRATLTTSQRMRLVEVLAAYRVIFAWGPGDMPGVDPKIICHRLAVNSESRPVKQKKRFLSSERREFVSKEVTTLQSIGHIKEVKRGIEPNPEKVRAILDMEAPRNVKEVQRLTGKLAALSRFLSKVADRAAPFFQAVKKSRGFVWTEDCQQSFESLKSYLLSPPILAKPEPGETLYFYLGVSPNALSSVLVREKGGAQHPVYYTAKTLRGAELRYSVAEKTVLAVVSTVQRLTPYFQAHPVQIPRAENAEADILSKLSSDTPEHIRRMANVEELSEPSIHAFPVAMICAQPRDWTDDIVAFLKDGSLPDESMKAKLVRKRAPGYTLEGEKLYKRAYNGTLLRCLQPAEAKQVMEELHAGICSAHQGAYAVSRKITLQGYIWPTIVKDCAEFVKKCKVCQEFQKVPGRPSTNYTPISTAIPFARWGLDLVGALPRGTGNVRYVIVAIDYFTKWVEAAPLASITGAQCQKFLAKQVICRFGVPEHIITDNGTQFESKPFNDFLGSWGIKHSYASVGYPQTNGQVENANRTIVDGLKQKLEACGGEWAEELPYILWTYRNTPRRATGETPFALCYGFEARAPAEISIATHREEIFDPERNEEALAAELHLVHERREAAFIRAENYLRKVKSYHDGRVRARGFIEGEWVLRKRSVSRPLEGGKFAKNYEGPYIIKEVVGPSTFRLQTPSGGDVPRTWNAENLVKFYQ